MATQNPKTIYKYGQTDLLPHERGEAEPLIAEHRPEHLSGAQDAITRVTLVVTEEGKGGCVAVQVLEGFKASFMSLRIQGQPQFFSGSMLAMCDCMSFGDA